MINKDLRSNIANETSLKLPLKNIRKLLPDALTTPLIAWFSINHRPMPWRQTTDPYAIWLSEIMLQQTQVVTVIPYFNLFIAQFPTVESVAAAPLEKVLSLWAGLGYYKRARAMHRCAQIITENFSGKFPSTYDELLTLPGIGRYTAGAIASIAFSQSVPVLDGNVMRVLARLLAIKDDIARPSVQKFFWSIAEQLTPVQNAGTYNQAMMELGATICIPRNPACGRCPVEFLCSAHALGIQKQLPVKSKSVRPARLQRTTAVIGAGDQLLLFKRPPLGLWGGLWEFPTFQAPIPAPTLAQISRRLATKLRLRLALPRRLESVCHQLTHRSFEYQVYFFRLKTRPIHIVLPACDHGVYQEYRWVKSTDEVPCGRITIKIAALLNEPRT